MIFGAMLGSSGLAETIGSGLNKMLGVSSALVITAMAAGVDPVIPAMAATFGASLLLPPW
nr:hypothetical protein [Corynebacterium sp.]